MDFKIDIEADLKVFQKAEPSGSPKAISAWMAMNFANRLITAARTMDRAAQQSMMMQVGRDLEDLAIQAEPKLIETGEVDSVERQSLYAQLDDHERRVLRGIKLDLPAPWGPGALGPILNYLTRLGLVTGFPNVRLTPRGEQIAAGIIKRWPKDKA